MVRPGAALIVGEPGWTSPQAESVRTVVVQGGFQDQNRAVALAAVETALGRPVDPGPMAGVVVPGRLEVRGQHPLEVWDGAHNPAGMRRLVAELPALIAGRPTGGGLLHPGREGRGGHGRAAAHGGRNRDRHPIFQ